MISARCERKKIFALPEMPSMCLLAGGKESGKYAPMGLALWRKCFWMPLHAQGETMACALDPFDNAVIGKRVDD
jgi:hypothetical protein